MARRRFSRASMRAEWRKTRWRCMPDISLRRSLCKQGPGTVVVTNGPRNHSLALDDAERAHPRYLLRQAGGIDHIDHVIDVLVRLGLFFREPLAALRTRDDSL